MSDRIITREDMANALINLDFDVNKSWYFSLTDDDETPSTVINKDGTVHSFGGCTAGFHGGLAKVLQFIDSKKYPTYHVAKKEADRLLGLENNVDFTEFEKKQDVKKTTPIPDKFMSDYLLARVNHFKEYKKELLLLFSGEVEGNKTVPFASYEKIKELSKKYQIGFSKKSKRLIMPIRNIDNQIMTFWKYKKYGNGYINSKGKHIKHKKVCFSKGRSVPSFGINELKEYAKTPDIPIVLTEGEKDRFAGLANGLHIICIGSAGIGIAKEHLHLFKGLRVIVAGDYDKGGHEFNTRIIDQLVGIAEDVRPIDWERKSLKHGFKLHNKFDLADYFAWRFLKEYYENRLAS